MRGLTILILLASLGACSVTTTHREAPPPRPVAEVERPPTEPEDGDLPAIDTAHVGVWESRPRIAGGEGALERYILGSDGRFVWQAAHHADPEAHPEQGEGYERFGEWGSTEDGIVLREQRRLVSQLAFTGCAGGEEQCECRDCACDACTDEEAEGECPCAWQSTQQMAEEQEDRTLALAECPEEVVEEAAADQNAEITEPCHMLGDTAFWHYADAEDADLRVQDAWGTASIQ